jgi:hypothetical protein
MYLISVLFMQSHSSFILVSNFMKNKSMTYLSFNYVSDAHVLYIAHRESQTWHSVNVHAMQWTGLFCCKHRQSWKSYPMTVGLLSHVWKAGSTTLPKLDLLLLLMWVCRHLATFLYMKHNLTHTLQNHLFCPYYYWHRLFTGAVKF